MSADWPTHSLSEFITIKHGFAFKGEYFQNEETDDYLVTPGNFSIGGGFKADKFKYYDGPVPDDYILSEGDLVVTMTDLSKEADTLGYSALIPAIEGKRLLHNQRIGLVEFKNDELDKTFLYFLLRSREYRHHVTSGATGSTVKHTSPTKIVSFEFKKPPYEVQVEIGKRLIAFENKILLNQKNNQTLEQIAQAIFKSWFVDFDPVRAKIAAREAFIQQHHELTLEAIRSAAGTEGDTPAHAAAKACELAAMCAISGAVQGRTNVAGAGSAGATKTERQLNQLSADTLQQLKDTAALFPDALTDTELGEIPEGWDISTLGELIEFNPRRTLKKGIIAPYLDMKNIPETGHIARDVINREMGSGTKFINGDTLLARITPCLENGKTAYVDFLNEGQVGWGSTEYIVMRPKDERPLSLGYTIARIDDFRQKAIQTMTGTSGRQRANAKALADLLWINYPAVLLKEFDKLAGAYLRHAKCNGEEIKSLSVLRDTLLPKLLSGELGARDQLRGVG